MVTTSTGFKATTKAVGLWVHDDGRDVDYLRAVARKVAHDTWRAEVFDVYGDGDGEATLTTARVRAMLVQRWIEV